MLIFEVVYDYNYTQDYLTIYIKVIHKKGNTN